MEGKEPTRRQVLEGAFAGSVAAVAGSKGAEAADLPENSQDLFEKSKQAANRLIDGLNSLQGDVENPNLEMRKTVNQLVDTYLVEFSSISNIPRLHATAALDTRAMLLALWQVSKREDVAPLVADILHQIGDDIAIHAIRQSYEDPNTPKGPPPTNYG